LNLIMVILAGGAGQRIIDITNGKPKVLLDIAGKTIIEYTILNAIDLNLTDIVIVTDKPEEFEDISVKYGRRIRIDLVKQREPEIRGAILSVKDRIGNEFFILAYGDVLAPVEFYRDVIDAYRVYHRPVMAVVPEEDVTSYGAAILDERGIVRKVIEKPRKNISGAYAIGGLYVLDKSFFEILEESEDTGEAISRYSLKYGILASVWSGWWVDIGFPWDLLKATYYVLGETKNTIISPKAVISSKASLKGPVIIEDDAVIDDYAIIKGPVYVGKGSYIGSHTLIREYTDIERNVIVSSYSEIVWSSMQKNSTIGRNVYLGFSVVGEGAVIEPNVTTMTLLKNTGIRPIVVKRRGQEYSKLGAFIGARSRVKVGSVLSPGTLVKRSSIYSGTEHSD